MKIDGKQFMNLQEAVGWLLENNALPFQSTNVFVGDTEISKSTIINPSPAQIRVGALVLFSDGKVGTVSAITSNGFMVDSNYTDLANIAKYITAVTVDASGHLIVTLSDGSSVDAGILKQISSFAMSGTDLIAYYNDGTSYNCGPIFVGSLTLPADLTVTDDLSVGGDSGFTGPATFSGNVTIATGKNLTVGGNATFKTAVFNDVATFNDEAYFTQDVSFERATFAGDVVFSSLATFSDNLEVRGDADVDGDVYIGGDLTVTGDAKIFENIVDANGNKRFIEGNITTPSMTGITFSYAKWSLSGTHLQIVIAFANEANAVFSTSSINTNLPQWIKDKIVPIYRTSYVDVKTFVQRADSDLSTTNIQVSLQKSTNVVLNAINNVTLTKAGGCRIQFDLIIDNA